VTGGREIEPGAMCDTFLAVAGRRSGKSNAMAVLAVYLSTLCDWSDVLSLGERGLALFLAPSERQAANVFRYAAAIIDASPALAELVKDRTKESLSLSTGIDLEVMPASWRRSRGGTAIVIVLDECAFFMSGDESANSDAEILTALRPLARDHRWPDAVDQLAVDHGRHCLSPSQETLRRER
jgi:phage terminase large subunit-like protein